MQDHAPKDEIGESPVYRFKMISLSFPLLHGLQMPLLLPMPGFTYLSCDMVPNSPVFCGFVWIRKLAVSTNWPMVAEKPERKALKGFGCIRVSSAQSLYYCPVLLYCDVYGEGLQSCLRSDSRGIECPQRQSGMP